MTNAINQLREAAMRVSGDTGNTYVWVKMEVKHLGPVAYSVYCKGRSHDATTLEGAIDKAINFTERDALANEAAKLRDQADKIERRMNELSN